MNKHRPPAWVFRLLSWFCPEHLYEEIEGDLLQRFERDCKRRGEGAAKLRLILNVVRFFRPGIILRRRFAINLYKAYMLVSYFKIGVRQLVKAASFSMINISGLSIGMVTAFFIFLYLNFEIGFDSFHKNRDELFRVVTVQHENDILKKTSAESFYGVASFLKESFPEVTDAVRCYKWPASTGILLNVDNKIYNERNYLFAEANFFNVFSSLLVRGDVTTVLSEPNAAVISKRLAIKLFGTTEVIGRSLGDMEQKGTDVVITGLMADVPANTHFDVDVVRPYSKDWVPEGNHWEWLNTYTYVAINEPSSTAGVEKRINAAAQKLQAGNAVYKETTLSLERVSDIHFSPAEANFKPSADPIILYVIGGAFIIVMLMAWINYINLETARFVARIREVAVRKIIGSSTKDIILQFLIQYATLYMLAMLVAASLIYFLLPFFTSITGVELSTTTIFVPWLWQSAILFFVAGTFVTGLVPALLLVRFNPVNFIKGKIASGVRGSLVRRSLLVFQFVSSSVLIAFLFVVMNQLEFMRNEKTNIDLSQVVTVYNPTNYSAYEDSSRQERNEVLRNSMLQMSSIKNMTSSSAIPGEPVGFTYVDLAKRSLNDADKQIPYKVIYVDYDFLNVYGLKLKAGRNYSPHFAADLDWKSLVVTERAVRELGFKSDEAALNQQIHFMAGSKWEKYTIVGIVEDYRHESVKTPVYPTIFFLHQNRGQMVYYSIAIEENADRAEALEHIEATWRKVWPEKPFQYFFMDSYYDQQYRSEILFANVFGWFSGIAAFIACLGIFGITLFESNSRLKEISIRKVLGATAINLFHVLTTEHFRLAMIALLIACPGIYYFASEWLAGYPVHVDILPIFFIAPPLMLLSMVVATALWQTFKMVKANPVDHIRHE